METNSMRCLLLLLSIIVLVRGQLTPKENCNASGEAMSVHLDYDLSSGFGVVWDPPAGSKKCVDKYTLCVTLDGSKDSPVCEDTNATTWSTRSVQPCSNYSVEVTAYGDGEKKLASGAVAFLSPPSEVINFTVANRTSSSLFMTWVVPADNTCVQRYVLSWRNTSDEEDERAHNLTASDAGYEVAGLEPCSMYVVSLTGVAADGAETSQGLSLFTAADGAPLKVSDVRVTLASSAAVFVRWTETSACVRWYRVCVVAVGDEDGACARVPDDDGAQWTSGAVLKPCTDYNVTVAAVDYAGQHSDDEFQVFAAVPGEVEELAVASRGPDYMNVTWSAPSSSGASCLTGYELYLCSSDDADACDSPAAELGPGATSYGAVRLDACKEYSVVLRSAAAENRKSYGVTLTTYTDVTDTDTALAGFGVASSFTTENVDRLIVEASWDEPGSHGCLSGYRVCYQDKKGGAAAPTICANTSVADVDWSTADVQYCTTYTVAVSAVTIGGQLYRAVSADVATPSQAVGNVTAEALTGTTIHVAWVNPPASSSACALSRVVRWCEQGAVGCNTASDSAPSGVLADDATQYTIAGLRNCTSYLIWVTALGSGTASEASFTYAKSGGGVPGNVSRLSTLDVTCGSVFIEWDEPSANAECVASYEVCWQEDSDGEKACDKVSYLDSQYEITGLRPSTWYNVTLSALGPGGGASEAALTRANTLATMQLEDLSLSSSTETSASVSWRSPTANRKCANEIVVSWCYEAPQSAHAESCELAGSSSAKVAANATLFNITDLSPCSNYTISVGVVAMGNVTSPRSTIRIRTLYESPVSVDKLHQETNSSMVNVSWGPPSQAQTCTSGFQVCWQLHEEYASPVCGHTTAESFVLDYLPACEVYTASVRTVLTDGSLSAASNVSLDLATPSMVCNLTVSKHSSDTIVVTWLPPLTYSECVKNYKICHVEAFGGNSTCAIVSGKETGHSITGLEPKTQYKITLIALGQEGRHSPASGIHSVTDASGHSNAGSSLGYVCSCGSLLASAIVFLLGHYLHSSDRE